MARFDGSRSVYQCLRRNGIELQRVLRQRRAAVVNYASR